MLTSLGVRGKSCLIRVEQQEEGNSDLSIACDLQNLKRSSGGSRVRDLILTNLNVKG